jgi:hypothetical protein
MGRPLIRRRTSRLCVMPMTTTVPMTIHTGQSAATTSNPERNLQRPVKGLARGVLQSDFRDPVAVLAIENVTARYQTEDFWVISPHERTQETYDEINRLDRARRNETAASVTRK